MQNKKLVINLGSITQDLVNIPNYLIRTHNSSNYMYCIYRNFHQLVEHPASSEPSAHWCIPLQCTDIGRHTVLLH